MSASPGANTPPPPPSPAPRAHRPPIVGLAGGIGSGKSVVARLLGERGAVVSDSDAQARALLKEPGIASILTRWWGTSILGADKLPDRTNVAALVFSDPAQRRRLEDLIHPILHSQRKAALLAARKAIPRPPLFVIDAPLLFEAGLDKECDAVIFVDAPRHVRLARIAKTRHWDEAELTRREAAQLPLQAKRSRSTFTIDNSAGGGDAAADNEGGQGGQGGKGGKGGWEQIWNSVDEAHLKRQIDKLWPSLIALRPASPRRA